MKKRAHMASQDDEIRDLEAKLEKLRGFKRSHTATFHGVAIEALASSEKADAFGSDAAKRVEASPEPTETDSFVHVLIAARKRQQAAATAIVFSALCVEAAINSAIDAKLSKFYVEGLDKLDVSTKWVVGLKLAYDHELKPDHPIVASLRSLAKARNALAHAKPRTLVDDKLNVIPDEMLSVEAARKAVKTAEQAIAYLQTVDPTLPEWSQMVSEWEIYGSTGK